MKGLFPQFDLGAKVDFKVIWEKAFFVFDTNVLLNLYRYQPSTRDQLLEVLEKLSDRIWIPHHVALEFQRNRVTVIADQVKRFAEVRSTIKKAQSTLESDLAKLQLERRHSLIDPAPLVDGFKEVADKFLKDLSSAQKGQQGLTEHDQLKEKIESLFDGRVGIGPSNQNDLDELYKTAEARYKKTIPPGYMDADKDQNGSDEHHHCGITYKRKYGDFVVWEQLLEHAKKQKIETLVFVTDDSKEDWWWKINADGPKTLGPRPELLEEARRVGEITSFHMYKPEGFLTYSKEYVKADVSSETLEEVRDISRFRSEGINEKRKLMDNLKRAEISVYNWLSYRFPNVIENLNIFPDFTAISDDLRFGFEVKLVRNSRLSSKHLQNLVHQARFGISEGALETLTFVWVADDKVMAEEFSAHLRSMKMGNSPTKVRSVVGVLLGSDGEEPQFIYLSEFLMNEMPSES